jgi:hypothetical protein
MVDTIIKGKLGTYIHAPNLQRLDLKFLKGRDAWSPNCFDTAFCGFFSSKPHLKEVHMKGVELTDSMIEQLGRCKSLSTVAHRRTGFSPFFGIGVQVKVSYDRIDIQVHNTEGIGKNRTAVH